MRTFKDLSREGICFDRLSLREQLIVLQNSALAMTANPQYWGELLLVKDAIDLEELAIVYSLISNYETVGPFFATHLEPLHSWGRYVHEEEHTRLLEIAEEKGLWIKYLGLAYYDPHLMGQVIHATNTIIVRMFPPWEKEEFAISTPLGMFPSYQEISKDISPSEICFVGAFSPMSVADIKSLHNILWPAARMTIIDIEGKLASEAAHNMGVNFVIADGLTMPFPQAKFDLILTNNLFHSLGSLTTGTEEKRQLRRKLFLESARVLRPDGLFGAVEMVIAEKGGELADIVETNAAYADAGFRSITSKPSRELNNNDLPKLKSGSHIPSGNTVRSDRSFIWLAQMS